MARAWSAYNGILPKPLKRVKREDPDDNVMVNRIRPLIDASVALLFGDPPGYELPKDTDGEETTDPSPEEKALAACLEYNNWDAGLLDYGINGGICGTPYLHIVPGKPYPRIEVTNPAEMTLRWDPVHIDVITAYVWRHNSFDPATGKTRVDRQLCERVVDGAGNVTAWTITDQHANLDEANLGQWITDEVTTWTKPYPPYLHNKNLPAPNQVYGLPDYDDTVIDLNKALNFTYSNGRKIARLHGHAKTWVRGIDSVALSMGPDDVLKIEGPEAGIGQLLPSVDPEAAIKQARTWDQAIEQQTMTPALLLGRDDGSTLPTSGKALKIRMWHATMKLGMKRKLYGPALVELYRRLLEQMGFGPDCRVKLSWPEPLPVDAEEERSVLLLDKELGASDETLLTKAGYNYQQELERKSQEAQALPPSANDFTNGPGRNMPMGGAPVDQQQNGGQFGS